MKTKLLSTLLAVLLVISVIPFTAIPASAVTQEFTHYTIAGQNLSNFENPAATGGN